MDAGVDAHGDAQAHREQGGNQGKFDGRRRPLGDDGGHRLLHLIGDAEIEPCRAGDKAGELHGHRIVEAQFLAQA